MLYNRSSQRVVLQTGATASLQNLLLGIQIPRTHPRSNRSVTLGVGISKLCFEKYSGDLRVLALV